MATNRKPTNPFYVLLVLAGTAFLVTALAYGVMMVRTSRPATGAAESNPAMMQFMRTNGTKLILIELAALGVFTVAAIGTDGYWERRAAAKEAKEST
jgi:hypothetical protein